MDLGLDGRVYVLTGASRGLGFATAQCLVADGARVVISARSAAQLATAVETLNDAGQRTAATPAAFGVEGDLGDPATPERLVQAAMTAFGRLDGALISVGGPPRGTATGVTDEQWRDAFETVFLGAVRTARTVVAALGAGGSIGMVLSTSARENMPGLGLSNGLRPGLAGVVKDMADEHGTRGIRIFGVMPHLILTDRIRELYAASDDASNDAAIAAAGAGLPLRRMGDPAEFGRVAAFLLSPAASYLTGLCVPVDGGGLRSA